MIGPLIAFALFLSWIFGFSSGWLLLVWCMLCALYYVTAGDPGERSIER